ncbi:collagen alpha-1(I) chain-like [Rhinolophus ferrumequinum]|uniref:collagen alpha-1(I) chain-like n=1 Tax=Rhinolophus ferrumequinum TaxID=59479 RepID=UPI00140FE80C|nr:collagen alpha-1(I) chain-like [Rhinolophus ferrumequinum]
MLPPGGTAAVSRGPAGARGGLGAPPPPSRPAPPGPAAARQRRLFGPRTLARTRSSRPRHVPGGGSGGSPAQGAVAGVAPLSPPPPPSAASLAPSASCAVAPRDSWRDRGGRGGPAPGPLTACHRQPGGASGWT